MSLQIIILNTNNQSNGNFSVSGVFWLAAPSSLIVPLPLYKSQIPNITADQLILLQNGTLVEQTFNTGLYPSETSLDDVKTDLQTLYTTYQTNLNNSAPPSIGFVGTVFDGYTWSISTSALNDQSKAITLNQPKDPNGALLMVDLPRTGTEAIYSSCNFCDKSSWYCSSIRVNDETLNNVDNFRFNMSNTFVIDMVSGRVLDDDGLVEEQQLLNPSDPHGYFVIVKSDGYIKTARAPFATSGGDYEIFYEDGYINFFNSQAGKTVVASYSYANSSVFILAPLPGKSLDIEAAESDFSSDIVFNDSLYYTVYGYVDVFAPQLMPGVPSGTKIPLSTGKYKRLPQILREAVGAYPALPANGALPEHYSLSYKEFRRQSRGNKMPSLAVPFRYATVRKISSAAGMELRVGLENDQAFDGETATITFYCTSKNE